MKYLYTLTFIILVNTAFGQISRAFITKDGNYSNDSKDAVSYIMIRKLDGDSAYAVNQYDMHDTIMSSGIYKDEMLKIPNGRFIYYYKQHSAKGVTITFGSPDAVPIDTNNYIRLKGYYVDGKREGKWIFYQSRGVIGTEYYYEKDKLNGPVTVYHNSDFVVREEGVMANDSLEGKYYFYNSDSLLVAESDFLHGRETNHILHYHTAKEPEKFIEYLEKNLKKFRKQLGTATPVIKFTLSTTGSVTNAEIVKGVSPEVDAAIAVLKTSPSFTPANYDYKLVQQKMTVPLFLFHEVYGNSPSPFVQKIVRYRPTNLIPDYSNGGRIKGGVNYLQ